MAVTDDERRRVAERLRMSDERDAAGFVDCLLAEVIRGREFCETPCEECHARLLGELADLIEPSIPADPGEAGLACVDAFIREHTEKPVDRDALLELSDGLEADADRIIMAAKNAQFGGGPRMSEAKHDASEWRSIARRIREACGEEGA